MADASVAADVDLVFDDVQSTLGGLDVLVNHAGIAGPTGPIERIGGTGWQRTIAVNLNSHSYFSSTGTSNTSEGAGRREGSSTVPDRSTGNERPLGFPILPRQ